MSTRSSALSSTSHTAVERVGQVLHLSEHGVGNHVIPLDASNGSFYWHAMAQRLSGDEAALRAFNGTRRGAGHVRSLAASELARSCGFQDSAAVAFGKKTDPEGAYIKKWLPHLAKLPKKYIYEPW